MNIHIDRFQDTVVLQPSGRLDASTAGHFQESATGLVDEGIRRIVVDLGQVDFLSSSGLRELLLLARRLRGRGRIALCSPREHVQQVLDVSGFSSIIGVFATQDEACRDVARVVEPAGDGGKPG